MSCLVTCALILKLQATISAVRVPQRLKSRPPQVLPSADTRLLAARFAGNERWAAGLPAHKEAPDGISTRFKMSLILGRTPYMPQVPGSINRSPDLE